MTIIQIAKTPNLVQNPVITYTYDTTIFRTTRLKEQRRSVRDIPLRSMKVTYLISDIYGQDFLNNIQYGHDKLFAIPIVDEGLVPTVISTGFKTITVSNNTTDMWNFVNLSTWIGIYEPLANTIETLEIDSYTTNGIITKTNILNSYTINNTMIYPLFFAVGTSIKITEETDGICKVNCDWKETTL